MLRRTKKSLSDLLLENGLMSPSQLEMVRQQTASGRSIRGALIDVGVIGEEELVSFISRQMNIPRIDLKNHLIDPSIIELIPEDIARKHQIIPVLKLGTSLSCVMVDVFNIIGLDEVQLKTGLTIEPAIALESEINKALDEHYAVKGNVDDVVAQINEHGLDFVGGGDLAIGKLKGMSEEAPIIKLVNMIVIKAVSDGASDVHIEPERDDLKFVFV